VEFAEPEAAQRAIDQLHNKEFQGRQLTINIARPREERPPRWDNQRGEPRGERRERQ
jgi:RNA recognition motif-containing protein